MITDWLTAIGTIGASVVALFIAIFHERLRALFWHPKLVIRYENKSPDVSLIPVTNQKTGAKAKCYYFRLRIYNEGKSSAEIIEVFIEEIHRRQADGKFELWQEFIPLNLVWSHYGQPYFLRIPPNVYKHCDLGNILEPSERQNFPEHVHPQINVPQDKTMMCLGLITLPNTGSYLLVPGVYRIVLVAVAANAGIVRRTIEVNLTGNWYADEHQMI
ncbi:MAG TPA: hypothetical protein VMV04_02845, partial [Thermodesulfobacteriota bacterium]|nr:hypothetical protein [Thermodesulfobacteriota bacterium]